MNVQQLIELMRHADGYREVSVHLETNPNEYKVLDAQITNGKLRLIVAIDSGVKNSAKKQSAES